jgi:hypothetical protein
MYIKPGANYKMNNATKNLLGGALGRRERSGWKKMMIQAELNAAIVPKSTKNDRKPKLLTGYVAVDGSITGPSDAE